MLGWRSLLVEQGCQEGGAPQPHLTRLMQGWSSPSSPCKPLLSPVFVRRQTFDPYTWKHGLEDRNCQNLVQDWPFHPQCTWQWFFLTKELAQEPHYLSSPPETVHTHILAPQWKPSRLVTTHNHFWVFADFTMFSCSTFQGKEKCKSSECFSWTKNIFYLINSQAAYQR